MWTQWYSDWRYTPEKCDKFFNQVFDYEMTKIFFTKLTK